MSDTFQGPGYWMASDGKWYPPERHPDPAYRAQFEPAGQPAPTEPEPATNAAAVTNDVAEADDVADVEVVATLGDAAPTLRSLDAKESDDSDVSAELRPPAIPGIEGPSVSPTQDSSESPEDTGAPSEDETHETSGFPTVGLRTSSSTDQPLGSAGTSLFDIHNVTEPDADLEPDDHADGEPDDRIEIDEHDSVGDDAVARSDDAVARSDDADVQQAPSFSVGSSTLTSSGERPVFDVVPPRSVTTAPEATSATGIELELGKADPNSRPRSRTSGPSAPLSTSTAVAVIPSTSYDPAPVSLLDRLLAATIFCAGVAMIVGTFLEWTTGALTQTGWERGDGIATVIAGVLGSAAAGPIYVDFHHIVPKSIAIICGLVGLVVVGLTAVSVLGDSSTAGTSTGIGFIVVLVGSAAMTLAGLSHRVDMRY